MNTQGAKCHPIYEIDFAIIDVNLFLDTHPGCCEATDLKHKLLDLRYEAIGEFERRHGPLTIFNADCGEPLPMPWQITKEG